MNDLFIALLPVSFGIALSPEIILLGMWVAGSAENALRKAWLFFAGGFVGVIIFFALGFFVVSAVPKHASWTRFGISIGVGVALIVLGFYSFFKGHHRFKKLGQHSSGRKVGYRLAAFLGFVATGLNLKVASMAMAAGHTLSLHTGSLSTFSSGIGIFFGNAILPLIFPAALETVRPGLVSRLMVPCRRLFEKYGKWIVLAICLFFGSSFIKNAFNVMP